MWHEGSIIFLLELLENVGSSVEGIYFVLLGWCESGLVRGVCVNEVEGWKIDN